MGGQERFDALTPSSSSSSLRQFDGRILLFHTHTQALTPGSMSNLPNQSKSDASNEETKSEISITPATSMAAAAAVDVDAPSTSQQGRVISHNNSLLPEGANNSQLLNGAIMRIRRELSDITKNPPPNCSAELYKEDLFHWRATVLGPGDSVYEDGIFKLDIQFVAAYPFRPPQIRFLTRIYHCNVDSRGCICLDVLNERWSPVMNVAKVLLSIWLLMGECNPNDPLVLGIAEQYKSNRKEHDRIARYWTKRFAMPKLKASGSKLEQEKANEPVQAQVQVQASEQSQQSASEQQQESQSK